MNLRATILNRTLFFTKNAGVGPHEFHFITRG